MPVWFIILILLAFAWLVYETNWLTPQFGRQVVTIAIFYLLSIVGAEVVTIFIHVQGGIIWYAVLLTALILHSSLVPERSGQKLFLSLALVPLIRILSLSMPLAPLTQIYWYPIIYIPLLIAALVVMRQLRLRPPEVGLKIGKLSTQMVVGASGVLFGVMEYFILRPEPLIALDYFAWEKLLLPAVILGVSTGFGEELIFRGVIQHASKEALGRWNLLYVSLIFAVLHVGHLSAIDVVLVFFIALFFSWVVSRTGSLLGVSLSHGMTNICLYLIIPFFA